MNEAPGLTSDEKLMGGVAHIFGPLVAIIVWATQKNKSRFIRFQALQALAFDFFIVVLTGIFFICLFGFAFLGIFGTMFATAGNAPSTHDFSMFFLLPFTFPLLIFACVTPLSIGILVLRLMAGVSVLNGRNYHYPLLGKWLENFLDD